MEEIYHQIDTCSKKMVSSTKFIDFFVHDILDYTILNKDSKNFTKNITVFNMKEAVDEIVESLNDKIKMKNITVQTMMIGFGPEDEDKVEKEEDKEQQ